MTLRRFARLSVGNGRLGSYVHSAVAPGLGKIGVLVALASGGNAGAIEALRPQLALHVPAAPPLWPATAVADTATPSRARAARADRARPPATHPPLCEKTVVGRPPPHYHEPN